MSTIAIRKADLGDVLHIVDVFNVTRSKMNYLPVIHTPKEIEDFFATLVKNGTIIVALYNKEIVGFMEIKDGWLNHLYILPSFQNKGIGKRLLDEAKLKSPKGISLMVFEDNKDAMKFYEREGFLLVEKRNQGQTTNEEHLPDRKYSWKTTS